MVYASNLIRKMKRVGVKEKVSVLLKKNKFTEKFADYDFRTIFFTVFTLIITVCYAIFYAVMGIVMHSTWYGVLACYYLMIVLMRPTVVGYHGTKKKHYGLQKESEKLKLKTEIKIYAGCGIVIILLTFPLSFAILQMVMDKATFSHSGLMIYVAATYTTYKVIATICHYRKAKKSDDFTVKTVRDINLADMFVSVLALQTAMFNSFSPDYDCSVFNSVTGAAVCLCDIVIGIAMIQKGRRSLRSVNNVSGDFSGEADNVSSCVGDDGGGKLPDFADGAEPDIVKEEKDLENFISDKSEKNLGER